jgi:hypothetical protein
VVLFDSLTTAVADPAFPPSPSPSPASPLAITRQRVSSLLSMEGGEVVSRAQLGLGEEQHVYACLQVGGFKDADTILMIDKGGPD